MHSCISYTVDLHSKIETITQDLRERLVHNPDSEYMLPVHRHVVSNVMDLHFDETSWCGLKDFWLDLAISAAEIPTNDGLVYLELEQLYSEFRSVIQKYMHFTELPTIPTPILSIDDLKKSPVFKNFDPKQDGNNVGYFFDHRIFPRKVVWPDDLSYSLGNIKPAAIWLVNEVLKYLKDGKNGLINILELLDFIKQHEACLVDSVYVLADSELPKAFSFIICVARCLMHTLIQLECNEGTASRISYILVYTMCSFRQIEVPIGARLSIDPFRLLTDTVQDFELGINLISRHLNWSGKKPTTGVYGTDKVNMSGKWEHCKEVLVDRARFKGGKPYSIKYQHTASKSLLNPLPENFSVVSSRVSQLLTEVETCLETVGEKIQRLQSAIPIIKERVGQQIERLKAGYLLIEMQVAVFLIEPPKKIKRLDIHGKSVLDEGSGVSLANSFVQQEVGESIAEFQGRVRRKCGQYGEKICVASLTAGLKDKNIRCRILDKDHTAFATLNEVALAAEMLTRYEEERCCLNQLIEIFVRGQTPESIMVTE